MTRATYTKPNSHAQKSGRKALCTVEAVCVMLGITVDDWMLHMFEYGCKHAELSAPGHEVAHALLTDGKFEYWGWWITIYLTDDEELLRIHDGSMSIQQYKQLKDQFI